MFTSSMTIHGCLKEWLTRSPSRTALTFMDGEGAVLQELTYRQWWTRAEAIANQLREASPDGARVMLLFEPGLDFAVALFGCLLSGRIAVPAYPPDPARLDRTMPRLVGMVLDAEIGLVLLSPGMADKAASLANSVPGLDHLTWLALPDRADEIPAAAGPTRYTEDPNSVALIQYTSGSTGRPKGVVLSHANIVANMRMMQAAASLDEDRIILSWLPVYHDLGLSVSVFLPAVCGCQSYQMAPADFLLHPLSWLRAIHKLRVTDTAVPNFALDLVVRKTVDRLPDDLDLSCLKTCLVGADMVRDASVRRFTTALAGHGLAPTTIFPSYGLAEAVVGVACMPCGQGSRSLIVQSEALKRGRIVAAFPDQSGLAIVCLGTALAGIELRIVDVSSRERLAEDRVGEIWVRGDNVARGYFRCGEDNPFNHVLEGVHGWLRTGDLGFQHAGELYVSGRSKDLIVIRGHNHFPQDIEATVEQANALVRRGSVIAFSTDDDGEEHLIIVAETAPLEEASVAEVLRAVQSALLREHGLQASIVLVKAGSIDKTSSGKLARQACKRRYIESSLDAIASNEAKVDHPFMAGLREDLIAVLGTVSVSRLSDDMTLSELGLDSLTLMDLAERLEARSGVRLSMNSISADTSLKQLTAVLAGEAAGTAGGMDGQMLGAMVDGRRSMLLSRPAEAAPIFCVGGLGGVALYLRKLADAFGPAQPFIALQPPGLFPGEVPAGSVEEMADGFLGEVLRLQPRGAYHLAGHSFGGMVALELARRLLAMGRDVAHVFMLDTIRIEDERDNRGDAESLGKAIYEIRNMLRRSEGLNRDVPACNAFLGFDEEAQQNELQVVVGRSAIVPSGASFQRVVDVYQRSFRAMVTYRPSYYRGRITLLRAVEGFPPESLHPERSIRMYVQDADLGWGPYCTNLEVIPVPGDHFSLVQGDNARSVASILRKAVDSAGDHPNTTYVPPPVMPSGRALEIDGGRVAFDPFHPLMVQDPYPVLRQMMQYAPVHQDVIGTWWITKHADVSAALRDKRFSAEVRSIPDTAWSGSISGKAVRSSRVTGRLVRGEDDEPMARLYDNVMIFVDNPRHAQLRKAFAPIFTPEVMGRWTDMVSHRVDALVSCMLQNDRPDVIRDIAIPLPVCVVLDILEVPVEDGEMVREWAHEVFVSLDPLLPLSQMERTLSAADRLRTYISGKVAAWNGQYDRSFMGCLAGLERSGAMSLDEVVANCTFFFAAAFETTTAGIGNSLAALFDHPGQWECLRARPELVDAAIDEFLRYDAPVKFVPRVTTEDVVVHDITIPKGSVVMLCLASANRDEDVFPNPDVLDVMRDARKQMAFSHGPHYCLGAALARIEMASALTALIKLDLRPVPGGGVRSHSKVIRGFDRLEVSIGSGPGAC